jgi:hypothetical protein
MSVPPSVRVRVHYQKKTGIASDWIAVLWLPPNSVVESIRAKGLIQDFFKVFGCFADKHDMSACLRLHYAHLRAGTSFLGAPASASSPP